MNENLEIGRKQRINLKLDKHLVLYVCLKNEFLLDAVLTKMFEQWVRDAGRGFNNGEAALGMILCETDSMCARYGMEKETYWERCWSCNDHFKRYMGLAVENSTQTCARRQNDVW